MPSKKSKEVISDEDFPSLSGNGSSSNTMGKWGMKKAWGAAGKTTFDQEPKKEVENSTNDQKRTSSSSASSVTGSSSENLTPPNTTRNNEHNDVTSAVTIELKSLDVQTESAVAPSPLLSIDSSSSQPASTVSPDANVSPYVGLRSLTSSSKNESTESPSPSITHTHWNFSATPFVPSVSPSVSSPDSTMAGQDSKSSPEESSIDSTENVQPEPSPSPSSPSQSTSTSIPEEEATENTQNGQSSTFSEIHPAEPSVPAPSNIFGFDDFPSLSGAPPVDIKPINWYLDACRNVRTVQPQVRSILESEEFKNTEVDMKLYEGKTKPMRRLTKTPQNSYKVLTNSYVVQMKDMEVFKYRVDIIKVYPGGSKRRKINGTKASDRLRQTQCFRILEAALRKFFEIHSFIYDGAILLHVPALLNLENIENKINFESSDDELPADLKQSYFADAPGGHFEIEFTPKGSFSTGEIRKELVTNNGSDSNKVRSMLQIAFTGEARREGFLILDGNTMYQPQEARVWDGKTEPKLTRSGISVGVTIAEGDPVKDVKGRIQVTIAHQVSNFYPVGPLVNLQKLFGVDFKNPDECLKVIRDLNVGPIYDTRTFEVKGLSEKLVTELDPFTVTDWKTKKERKTTVLEEGAKHGKECGITVYNKQFRAVKNDVYDYQQKKTKTYHHLMENLKVYPDQKISAKLKDAPAAPPISERVNETRQAAETAQILTPNKCLAGFGASVDPKRIEVDAVRIEGPQIIYSKTGSPTQIERAKGSWKLCKTLIRPVTIKSVLILYRPDSGQNRRVTTQIEKFSGLLADHSSLLGKKIPRECITCEDISQRRGPPEVALRERIVELKKEYDRKQMKNKELEIPYVFYADAIQNSHGYVKLIERELEVLIEHLDVGESLKRMNESTSKSIILKMNIRKGGMNHEVRVNDPSLKELWGKDSNTLIISYDVCFCAGAKIPDKGQISTEPSTIGFGFNGTRHPEVIIGDFHYQNPRKEIVIDSILADKTSWMMQKYYKARGKLPKNVFVVRDGVSDGQYRKAMNEFNAIQRGAIRYQQCATKNKENVNKIKFSMLVVTKRHSHRFHMINELGMIVNISPLTAINEIILRKHGDEKTCNPKEVFFVPHKPVDGTAAPHMVNVLHNEIFESFDQLMKLMAALCCAHQVSNSIGSLPDSIVAADSYAKRGAEMFEAYKKKKGMVVLPLIQNNDPSVFCDTDWEKVSKELCYEETDFKDLRMA